MPEATLLLIAWGRQKETRQISPGHQISGEKNRTGWPKSKLFRLTKGSMYYSIRVGTIVRGVTNQACTSQDLSALPDWSSITTSRILLPKEMFFINKHMVFLILDLKI